MSAWTNTSSGLPLPGNLPAATASDSYVSTFNAAAGEWLLASLRCLHTCSMVSDLIMHAYLSDMYAYVYADASTSRLLTWAACCSLQ